MESMTGTENMVGVAEANPLDNEGAELEELLNGGFRYAFSLCQDRAEAEDLVQDACASILRVNGPWQKSYFFTTIRNQFIDRYRRERRLLFLPLEGSREGSADLIDGLEDERWVVPDVIAAETLERAFAKLRPEERETMYLAVVEEYTAQEIAEMTNRPRGTILSLLHRTRKKLREILEKEQGRIS